MTTEWKLMIKPTLVNDIIGLSPKEAQQIMEKLQHLTMDPLPDGRVKKEIRTPQGQSDLYRIRSGIYRIIYTFDEQIVSILAIRQRDENTYQDEVEVDRSLDATVDEALQSDLTSAISVPFNKNREAQVSSWEHIFKSTIGDRVFPEPITIKLLHQLRIPQLYHWRLLHLKTEDELLSCPGIEDEILLRIDQYMFDLPLKLVTQQPNLILNSLDDLHHYITYYTCFLSYSSKDQAFATQLHSDLQRAGVRCWYAPEDLKIGDKFWHRIDESIRLYDKLLLVLSDYSVQSEWVEREVMAALEKEKQQTKLVLFPIRLDHAVMNTSLPWGADIRRSRHIGNFTHWQHPHHYQTALQRLLRDLNAASTD